MGQDRENRAGGDAGMTEVQPRPDFDDEVSADVRYERGLAVKAAIAIATVVIVALLRALFFS
jgi:hypothetical protein